MSEGEGEGTGSGVEARLRDASDMTRALARRSGRWLGIVHLPISLRGALRGPVVIPSAHLPLCACSSQPQRDVQCAKSSQQD